MKNKKMKVKIPNACTVGEENFSKVSKNCDYCKVCATLVYDFTSATEEDFLRIFQENQGEICARGKLDKNGDFVFKQKTILNRAAAAFFSAVSLLGVTSCAGGWFGDDSPDAVGNVSIEQAVVDADTLPDTTRREDDIIKKGKLRMD